MTAALDLVGRALVRLRPNGPRTFLMVTADEAQQVLEDLVGQVAAATLPSPAAAPVADPVIELARLASASDGFLMRELDDQQRRLEELRELVAADRPFPEPTRSTRRWDLASQLLVLLVERGADLSSLSRPVTVEAAHRLAEDAYAYATALVDRDDSERRYEIARAEGERAADTLRTEGA